jgi:O-antigen ligase
MGLVALYAVQSSYSADFGHALEQVVFFYVPFALLFVLLARLEWTPRLAQSCLAVLVGLALVFAAIGFVEYSTRTLLLNPKVIASNEFESSFRVNSLFFDPNIYGRFLALVMLGVAGALLWTRRRRDEVGAAVVLAILWAGLLLTFSQSSMAALLVGLAVLGGLRWSPRAARRLAGAAVVVGVAIVVIAPGALRLDLGSSKSADTATSGRYDLMKGGLRLFADRPLYGWGAGSFPREFRRHEKSSEQKATSASHTIPITVAAEQGLIGLALYVILLAAALRRLFAGARGSPEAAVVAAAFAALLFHTMLYAAFLEDPLTWTLLGVGTALARPQRR